MPFVIKHTEAGMWLAPPLVILWVSAPVEQSSVGADGMTPSFLLLSAQVIRRRTVCLSDTNKKEGMPFLSMVLTFLYGWIYLCSSLSYMTYVYT